MEFDPAHCEIRTPTGEALLPLYRMLMEVFPADRGLFSQAIERNKRLYTWTPYTLYRDDEPLGNVSLVPMQTWLDGRPVDTLGVASVATPVAYRGRGIAGRLLRHCLDVADCRKLPAVLFTSLPDMYRPLGFEAIRQSYHALPAKRLDFGPGRFDFNMLDTLDDRSLLQISRLYTDEYPNYDGKIVRDADYWQFYRMLVDPYPKVRMLFCLEAGQIVGYARLELEADRLLVSELCRADTALDAAESLLTEAGRFARRSGLDTVALALAPAHFIWPSLQSGLSPEPANVARETFMVRPAPGQPLGPLAQLQWPLADKF